MEALETPGARPCLELWDVLASLDGQAEELREKAIFQEGLALGLELAAYGPGDGLSRPIRRCPVDCPYRKSRQGSGSGKRRFVRPDFARRSIEGSTEGPVSAFLWISKTVSFGKTKEMVFGKRISKGSAFGCKKGAMGKTHRSFFHFTYRLS